MVNSFTIPMQLQHILTQKNAYTCKKSFFLNEITCASVPIWNADHFAKKNSIHFFREGRFSETPLFPYFNYIKYFTKIVRLFFRRNITSRKH